MTPRLQPLPEAEWDDTLRELIAGLGASNIFTTMARHPKLFRDWLQFGGRLLMGGRLPGRDRELLILRTAFVRGAAYEWGHHVGMALGVGLTQDEIDRVAQGPDAAGWAPFDATLLRAADQLIATSTIDEPTWTALAADYDEQQLIEVPMLVGHYTLLSCFLNAIGVEPEDGVPPMPGGV